MSFSGDLEHMPIVDVIQLLHQTNKSGTLRLKCPKGECQLGFKDGYIVSANYLNNIPRIGQILVEMKALTKDALEKSLSEQKESGRPLIAMLIESGQIKKDMAFKGLEALIEMTLVEALTWSRGSFELDVKQTVIADEYRYFHETLKEDFYVSTQSVLMDALRIYDEKKRDGTLKDQDFSDSATSVEDALDAVEAKQDITADLLGLDEIDKIGKKIPRGLGGMKIEDPVETHRAKIGETLKDRSVEEQEAFITFLMPFSGRPKSDDGGLAPSAPVHAVILLSRDELVKYTINTILRHEGFFVFTTDEAVNLNHTIDQSLSKGFAPVLVLDSPDTEDARFSKEMIADIRRKKSERYPHIPVIQFSRPDDYDFSVKALKEGVRAVFPSPARKDGRKTFVSDAIQFYEAFLSYLKKGLSSAEQGLIIKFKKCVSELNGLNKPSEIFSILLNFTSGMFERAITFVHGKSELVAGRGIGLQSDNMPEASAALKFSLPLSDPSVFKDTVEKDILFFGQSDDGTLKNRLFKEIGVPHSPTILLLPVKSLGKVVALIYGDFGAGPARPVRTELLETLALHAGITLDNALYRKRFEKTT